MPEIVPAEFKPVSVDVDVDETADKWVHPITGSSQRYILGDRFHSTTNPHKSPLCSFHDINLCLQANSLKTSYQEAENNRKKTRRDSKVHVSRVLEPIFYLIFSWIFTKMK